MHHAGHDLSNHYDNATDAFLYKLGVHCNDRCQCNPTEYHPVCAEFMDGSQMAYYSPCYAGCPDEYNPLTKEYFNCTCAPESTKGGFKRVKKGYCESKCRGLFAFLFLFAPFCFFTFAVAVPLITVVLRTVDYAERSFALGIQWILVRIIGTIPAPVLFGWIFDVSCIKQHLDPCSGEHGSCMLYQNKLLADLFLAFSVAGQLIAIICLVAVLMFFAASLRDDPLPATADDRPQAELEEAAKNEEEYEDVERKSNRSPEFEPMLAEQKAVEAANGAASVENLS
ncbi:Protein F53B1.8 [Aphelenchoides avenae]|nr:Protein F53B1.8 [Aphelenchus avenae]